MGIPDNRGSILSRRVFFRIERMVKKKCKEAPAARWRAFPVIVADNFRAVYYGPDKEVGIETVKGIETATDDAKIYNVAGQRVSKLQRGVNIIGNKKVVVK